jgi:hypothetical protein
MKSNESDKKELEQLFAVVFANGHVRILPFVVLLLPNQKNERVLLISGSERPIRSARKAGWSFPSV